MAKELPYFRFTSQEWQNGKISLESYHLKGLFIEICSYYWVQNCKVLEVDLHKKFQNKIDVKKLRELKIIKLTKKGEIKILFLDEQLKTLTKSRKLKQLAGSQGGKKKATNAIATLQQNSSYKDKDKDKDRKKKDIPHDWRNETLGTD